MTPPEQIAAIAAVINPLASIVDETISKRLGGQPHIVVLIVAAHGEAQFTTTGDYATTCSLMREIAPKFALGPGEPETATKAERPVDEEIANGVAVFDRLLTHFETAILNSEIHAGASYRNARESVIEQFRRVLVEARAR